MAVAVAAIRALTGMIKNSNAQTMMGLEKELKDAAAALQRWVTVTFQVSQMLLLQHFTAFCAKEALNTQSSHVTRQ